MKFKHFFCLSIVFGICLTGCKKEEQTKEVAKFLFGNLDEDEMPIFGWCAPDNPTNETYRLMKECGFNTIIDNNHAFKEGQNNDVLYKGLEYASNNNINYLLTDRSLLNTIGDEFIDKYSSRNYSNYSSFAGFLGNDEPSISDFENIKTRLENFKKYDKEHLFYINLLGEYTKADILKSGFGNEYDDNEHPYHYYISKFLKDVNYPFVSIDHYPCIEDFPTMRQWYYERLEIASRVARENNVPFWNFILATEHYNERLNTHYRNPSLEELYWQVNSSFIYGAKGIEYFCYQSPSGTAGDGWTYGGDLGGSCITDKGEISPTYYLIKEVNNYISRIDHILVNSTKKATIHYDSGYGLCQFYGETVEKYGEIEKLDTYDELLISCMDFKGKNAYLIFNPTLEYDSHFSLTFNKEITYNIFDTDEDKYAEKGSSFEADIKPGEAILLEVAQ